MSHAENFVHTWSDGVNRGGATDFVFKFWGEFAATGTDGFAFFAIWIPSVFFLGAGFLAESRESDLGKAVFDDFVTRLELVFFPVAELGSGSFDGFGNFGNLFLGKWIIIYLNPIVFSGVVTIILRSLGHKQV